jgi:tRNA pseudouridine55 synthase
VNDDDYVVLYDKPRGITSHDVVARVRRTLPPGTKVGHAGTLDPFATGLLLVLIGRATRVQRFLMVLPKTYEATALFGARSSTGDPEGEIVTTGVVPEGDLSLPTGVVRQRPPAYSAVKLGGQRAYALARAGIEVELPERDVEVYRFEETERAAERRRFVIECSAGTYVRSLISSLGDAYCEELRRTRIGPFDVADADPGRAITLNDALSFLPEVRLDSDQARRASHGARVPWPNIGAVTAPQERVTWPNIGAVTGAQERRCEAGSEAKPSGLGAQSTTVFRLTDTDGLIALAEPTGGDELKPIVGFRG